MLISSFYCTPDTNGIEYAWSPDRVLYIRRSTGVIGMEVAFHSQEPIDRHAPSPLYTRR